MSETFAPTSFLEAWRILKTLLKSPFRSRSDKNQSSKFIHLGISPPVYHTHLDNCSKTAIQCKQLTGWNFSLRASNGKGPIDSFSINNYFISFPSFLNILRRMAYNTSISTFFPLIDKQISCINVFNCYCFFHSIAFTTAWHIMRHMTTNEQKHFELILTQNNNQSFFCPLYPQTNNHHQRLC